MVIWVKKEERGETGQLGRTERGEDTYIIHADTFDTSAGLRGSFLSGHFLVWALKTAVVPHLHCNVSKMPNKFIPAAPNLRLSLPESDSKSLRVDDFVVYFPGRSQFVILTGGWSGSRLMTWTAAPQWLCSTVYTAGKTCKTHSYSAMLIFALVHNHVAQKRNRCREFLCLPP